MGLFDRVLRSGEGRKLKALQSLVPDINALEAEMQGLSDDALRHKTVEFRERIERGRQGGDAEQEILNELLIEAFAVVREGAVRALGQRHYDVQMIGGAALHFGWIAEMKTGEGKTLVSTLPVYLNGLAGRGVHLITVNDYLAEYHAELMGRVYRWLGLTVGLTNETKSWSEKQEAYACDVTYGINSTFGFDYLRDNMARSKAAMMQRGHVFAIVDEVDSILIDEARTPLIISMPATESARMYHQFAGIVRQLQRDVDYEVDEEKRNVVVTEEGIDKVERALGVENLYDLVAVNYVHQLDNALKAKELYHRDKDYIVDQGQVKIVDEFTGRILEGRRWSDGLHQAVEAKERVKVEDENHTAATITLQNYFRMYEKLAGMTGTAETEAAEFASVYDLPVVPVPTHRPNQRIDQADLIYKSEAAKFAAVVEEIQEKYDTGQPVLVGTASVAKSEILSSLLERKGVPHNVLNAKTAASGSEHAKEANIVAQAGRLHSVTVSTNMAGRGVDILLGGNPEGLATREVVAQGLDPESEEGQARYKELLATFEEQCKREGEQVRELGGLYVLGSERHESRRIDNQLRGRSGRQGDPGESRFYLSLEDDLMRLFATGAMNWVMGRALPDDVPIEAKMVTKAIERAQSTVEARNAEIRKDVLKYDEVMNEQRKVIYARRMQVIDGEDLQKRTMDVLEAAVQGVVDAYCDSDYQEDWDVDTLLLEIQSYYPTKFTADELRQATGREHLVASLVDEAQAFYAEREQTMPGGPDVMRQIEREIMLKIIDQRWQGHLAEMDYLREGINLRAMGQQDPLQAWQQEGFKMFGELMAAIDDDYLKYVMHVQLVEDKPEADPEPAQPDLSKAQFTAAEDTAAGLPAPAPQPFDVGEVPGQPAAPQQAMAEEPVMQPIVRSDQEKLGRNQPCWCGSGKKFKLCHGR